MIAGMFLRHKPRGETSFSLVRALKAELAQRGESGPIVHGGALDPFAEGLLPLLTGPATRLFELLHALPKTYRATVEWGRETDTGDHLGSVIAEGAPETLSAEALTPARIDAGLAALLGSSMQEPPAFSNKRVDGERAHVRARRGEEVSLTPQRIFVLSAVALTHDLPRRSVVDFVCRGGTYVRTLARDVGRALGCRAHLSTLSRSAVGPFADPGPAGSLFVRGPDLLPWARTRVLTDDEARRVELSRLIPLGDMRPPSWVVPEGFPDPQAPIAALHAGALVALLSIRGHELKPVTDLRDGAGRGL
ncbi:MAG: tRNA pseudouridine(55) synthase [Deltaproteobacteria bacterium]|nr:tRNA pseudouridine(55) synthase [Deltaproteobacteria bacterium]